MLENENINTTDEVVDSVPHGTESIGGSGVSYTETVRVTSASAGSEGIGFSIGSLVCGILSIMCCCMVPFSFVLAVAGIVLGAYACYKGYAGKGLAIAGIITASCGLFLTAIAGLMYVLGGISNSGSITFQPFY